MALADAQKPQWDRIDTVLLDLDGTLLDLAFDNGSGWSTSRLRTARRVA